MSIDNPIDTLIRSFILKTFPLARNRTRPLDGDTLLLQSGIVDSAGVLEILAFLEKNFAIQIADEELTPENFATVTSLSRFVKAKQPVEVAEP
jgi:acyl carrier protein